METKQYYFLGWLILYSVANEEESGCKRWSEIIQGEDGKIKREFIFHIGKLSWGKRFCYQFFIGQHVFSLGKLEDIKETMD